MCEQKGINREITDNVSRAKTIFLKYGNFLKVLISWHIDNQEDADDFFQELFLFISLKPLPSDIKNIKGLLSKIVSDRAKDFHRKKANAKRRISKYSEIVQSKTHYIFPESEIVEKEEVNKFFDIVENSLPPQEARAVILKYKHDKNNQEIADKMKVDSRSVSRYVSVGLKKLKKLWA